MNKYEYQVTNSYFDKVKLAHNIVFFVCVVCDEYLVIYYNPLFILFLDKGDFLILFDLPM